MKKILLSFLMFFSVISGSSDNLDTRDQYGRTPLMNFIIRQEVQITQIKADIHHLYKVCYYEEEVFDGSSLKTTINPQTGLVETTSINKYKTVERRRHSCTDADILAHKQRQQDLNNMIEETVNTIRFMARNLYIDATDSLGYTAQNYCYTYEIYAELRRQGAQFQLVPFIYFNPLTSCGVAALSCGGIAGIIALTAAATR